MTHITWSIEKADKCPDCGGETILVVAPTLWDSADDEGEFDVAEEISGHYCQSCRKLVSLSLNTDED